MESKSHAAIDLSGKVAIVTGAGRGIGAAIAETFAGARADLVIADIDEDNAQKVAEKMEQLGRTGLAVNTDVAAAADVDRLFETVQVKFGGGDILVNNTGSRTSAAQGAPGASQALFRVNPLRSRGEPEDIAHAALFLASPMAGFITGQTLVVNGGTIGGS